MHWQAGRIGDTIPYLASKMFNIHNIHIRDHDLRKLHKTREEYDCPYTFPNQVVMIAKPQNEI